MKTTSTNDLKKTDTLHKVRQSINQKVERSEKDVIDALTWTLGALFILQLLDLIFTIANI